jgi:hypothetical protein
MKKITPLTVLAFIFVLAIGCADDFQGDFNNLSANNQDMIVNAQDKLFETDNNKFKTSEKKISFNSKFTVWSDPPPVGYYINATISGSGTATRMGKAKLAIQEIITTIPDTDPWKTVAEVVITAANGEELYFSYTSTVDVAGTPVMSFAGSCEVKGGTGSFKNAKGTLEYNGSRSWETGTGTAFFTGEISF